MRQTLFLTTSKKFEKSLKTLHPTIHMVFYFEHLGRFFRAPQTVLLNYGNASSPY